jgi:transcription-repair coupling factor (superfamily II helicase)
MRTLLRRLESGEKCVRIRAALGAHAFLAVLLRQLLPDRTLVAVTTGLKTQETFHQDSETWLAHSRNRMPARAGKSKDDSLLFYPAWESLPHEGKLPHADVISERLETLTALSASRLDASSSPRLIVTGVSALLQRTFPPEYVQEHTRLLRRGDSQDPLDLIEWLEEQGYEPEAQVSQKGEICMRGGIVDVYPLASPWPVRLEFFGDELESLRFFDPFTQVSREEIDRVTIPPGGELNLLRKWFLPGAPVRSSDESRVKPPSHLSTLIEHLPASTIFLFSEPGLLAEQSALYSSQIPPGDPFYIDWDELLEDIARRGMVRLDLSEDEEPAILLADDCEAAGGLDAPQPPFEMECAGVSPPVAAGESNGGLLNLGFESLELYRPMGAHTPDPQVAEAGRRDFFLQLHRWMRRGRQIQVFCNNDGEKVRFLEIWRDYGLDPASEKTAGAGEDVPNSPDAPNEGKDVPEVGIPAVFVGALSRGFVCDPGGRVVVTDAEIFGRYKVQRARRLKTSHATAMRSALQIDFSDLEEGDYVVHMQYGIGRYQGCQTMPAVRRKGEPETEAQECLVIEYAPTQPEQPPPKLYVPVSEAHLVGKYIGAGKARPQLHTLGGSRWTKAKAHAEHAVRDLAGELLSIQAARASQPGHACAKDTPWQREFEGSFLYEETADQLTAIQDTKNDMESTRPMDRLICGDVGFGKTEVALRAAFKAVMDGKQAAVLVPTTVLAQQHYNSFRERMADYPVRVEMLSRFRSRREQQQIIRDLASGAVDIVIGTHRLVQGDVQFKDLGLVVVDEEQRFGVMHKERFKQMRKLVDVLTLSATPIPRTLHLALTGARDMSTIETPPHDRLPVETIVIPYDETAIRNAIQREINRQGQVFFLHNRVDTIDTVAARLAALVPQARLVVGHGQMDGDALEEVMAKFVNGEADVLLSTTIIESGLDIPNANTIIIDRADRFGLSDLYQLRGRVGRYKHQAYAYLLLPRHAGLLTDARKRIGAIKQYSSLGSGFKIAMRDLEIRGAGSLLGAEQSGHITAIGFELYCQLLQQSISAIKGEPVKARIDVVTRLDFLGDGRAGAQVKKPEFFESRTETTPIVTASACLPVSYVPDTRQRVSLYRKLAEASTAEALDRLRDELKDRFGPVPPSVDLLLQVAALKILASEKKVVEIETQGGKLMLKRGADYLTVGGKFPRLTKKQPKARLKEIRSLLMAM